MLSQNSWIHGSPVTLKLYDKNCLNNCYTRQTDITDSIPKIKKKEKIETCQLKFKILLYVMYC